MAAAVPNEGHYPVKKVKRKGACSLEAILEVLADFFELLVDIATAWAEKRARRRRGTEKEKRREE